MDFNKLKTWKLGHNIWTVKFVRKLPKHLEKKDECGGFSPAVSEQRDQTIWIENPKDVHPFYVLETLIHELKHVLDIANSIDEQINLRRGTRNDQIEDFVELETQLFAMRFLDLWMDNIENFSIIHNYLRRQVCSVKRKRKRQ